jgi:Bacterial RNA polymerase, alpha chain C terminal domain
MHSRWAWLPIRVRNVLANHGIHEIAELTALSERDLRDLGGLGPLSVAAVHEFLAERGLALSPDERQTAGSVVNSAHGAQNAAACCRPAWCVPPPAGRPAGGSGGMALGLAGRICCG